MSLTNDFAAHRLTNLQQQDYWADRLEKQLAFTQKMLSLRPEDTAAASLLRQAGQVAAGQCDMQRACEAAEAILAPLAHRAKEYSITCVGHAHIDMNWMWSWPETVHVVNDTFSTVLNLMDEFPTFHFSQSQASVYQILVKYHPKLLERIAQRVREGRWEVVASHWVENDKVLVAGEALCRHLLYTRQYMQRLFGLKPEDVPIDWSPDTFGQSSTTPGYLRRGGVKYLYLHRPGVHTPQKHELFWWEGDDGSRVLTRNDMRLAYNGKIDSNLGQRCLEYTELSGLKQFLYVYGVGDHGGGPTRRDLERALDLAQWPVYPTVRFGTAKQFFESVENVDGIPVIRGELNTEFAGCYTSQSLIKKCNRYSEARLYDAEVAAVVAAKATGEPYPAARLAESWQDTLFSHFHDILPGSGVHDTRTYAHGKYQEIMANTSMIETLSLRQLATRIDTASLLSAQEADDATPPASRRSGQTCGAGMWTGNGNLSCAELHHQQGERALVVFNSVCRERKEILEVVLWDNAPVGPSKPFRQQAFSVRCPDGTVVAAQMTADGCEWGHDYVKLSFPVTIPSCGYATYIVREGNTTAPEDGVRQLGMRHHCCYAEIERNQLGLDNGLLRLEIDPHTGGIRRLTELASETVLIDDSSSACTLQYAIERPHRMTAWLIEHTGVTEVPQVTAIRQTLRGPFRAAVQVDMKFGTDSAFTLTYELRHNDPKLYLSLRGRWGERGSAERGVPSLRLRLPLALKEVRARHEIAFGSIERPFNREEEMPALEWAQAIGISNGKTVGCLLLNDSKHGHALAENVLYLSLIRASYDPDPLPEIGWHEISLALQPLTGDLSPSVATEIARCFNHPLRAIGTTAQKGELPLCACALRIEAEEVVLSGLKMSEDGGSVIVRLYECAGKKQHGRIVLDPAILGKVVAVREVDLLERELSEQKARPIEGNVEFWISAKQILSLKLELQPC